MNASTAPLVGRSGTTRAKGLSSRASTVTGIVIVALLSAVGLGLAFRSGAYSPGDWLPFLIGVAALAVVVSVSGPAVPSGRVQKVLLALFALLAVWTAASILWATSLGNAWEEINRTLFYAVAMALAFAAVRWAGSAGLNALAALVAGAIGVLAVVVALRLAVGADATQFLVGEGRLNYPISYYNGLACLLMVGFWLVLGIANGVRLPRPPGGDAAPCMTDGPVEAAAPAGGAPAARSRFPRWSQPLLLVLSVFLLELALLPQSRGAFWTFFLVVPFFVILSPHRFRALVDLAIVALPVILFWSRLNGVFPAVRDHTPLGPAVGGALHAIGYSVLIVLGVWGVTWLIERWVGSLARRAKFWIGIALVAVALAGAAAGLIYADGRTGGLGDYLGDRWAEFTSDEPPATGGASRFTALGLSGRVEQWKVAAQAFQEHPLLGIGAQNFELYHYQHRTIDLDVRQPHSQPMQFLAELGLPGLLLYAAFVLAVLARAVVLRFRSSKWTEQAVLAAMMTAVLSWLVHSSADWLWQLTAVTLPVMMLFGGLIAAGGAASGARTRRGTTAAAAGAPVDARALATAPAPESDATPPQAPERRATRSRKRRPVSDRLHLTRPILTVLALAVLVSAALPYLSLRYCSLAAGSSDLQTMTARTATAAALDPTSIAPFATRAAAHQAAAAEAPEGSLEQIEQLKLAAAAWVEATEREPGGWLYFYLAADAFVQARDAALVASTPSAAQELEQSARFYLDEAKRLNPLSDQTEALEKAF